MRKQILETMGTSVTYERALCRFLNRKGVYPLKSVQDFFDELLGKEDVQEEELGLSSLYPLEHNSQESQYLSVDIKKWKYEFRLPRGENKKWEFICMTAKTQ